MRARAQRPAAQAPAAASPQISIAGVRVVGPGLGANASEISAFNERPGVTIALFIKAPTGSGIVDIDDDASRIDAFTDDKGQSLLEEGDIGSFPKVSEDGSVGLIDIEVRARPSAGAVSVNAQGSVAMTLAGGSKPQRIANVRLEAGQTVKLGTATIALKEITAGDESMSITLGLTRPLMTTIRDVRFFDAKGVKIESRRTSSGYMGDAAELAYDVKTKDKAAAVEFDIWQNMRQVKVPFNVKASVALDR